MVNPFAWIIKRRKAKSKNGPKNTKFSAAREAEIEDLVKILQDVPLLSNLQGKQLKELAECMKTREYEIGENVITQGETGDGFYIIEEGTCEVLVVNEDTSEEQRVQNLNRHDYFGEQALLQSSTRNATIRATSELKCFTLDRSDFQKLNNSTDVMFAQRRAVMAEDMDALTAPEQVYELSEEELAFIRGAITDCILFNGNEHLMDAVVPFFHPREYNNGDIIIAENEMDGKEFFVIKEGMVRVNTEASGDVCTLESPTCFGDLALLYNAPRNATITADSETVTVYVMDRAAYKYHQMNLQRSNDDERFQFLRGVNLFKPLCSNEITLIDMALQEAKYVAGEVIFNQGDAPDKFYLVSEGCCEGLVTKENGDTEDFVKLSGSFFGELALRNDQPRAATIVAGSNGCTLLELSKEAFVELLGPLQQIIDSNAAEYAKPINERKNLDNDTTYCDLHELQTIGLLGRGAFGKVTLVIDPNTKRSYALKAIKKTQIEELGQSSHIVTEKRVMELMNNRFLVNLRRTYKDEWRVYFLVDVCLGGELFTILRRKRSFNEEQTQFYVGCVVEAFDYMHSQDIIYRDLKPENLVMDSNGYIKVTDFGFAKVVPKKTYTLCGTPDYLAPEIVTGQGHGKAVDWWCVGVLIYELLSSFPPFFDDEPMGTYRKIIQGKFKFPKYFTAEARDVIARLLRTKPTKRLAVMKGGADNIRNHMWYKGFEWEALREGQLQAPYIPEVKSLDDLSNFDQKDRRSSIPETGKPPVTAWDVAF